MSEGLFHHIKQTFGLSQREEKVENHTLFLEHIQKLTIDACAIDVFVDTHEVSEIHVEFKTFEDGPEMEITESDVELMIHITQVPQTFNFNTQKAALILQVPPAVAEEWTIMTTSRRVSLQNIQTENLHVRGSSGVIDCKTIQADQVKVEATSGDIVMDQIAARHVETSVSSGTIRLLHIHCEHIHSSATSGENYLQTIVSKTGVMECGSGRIMCNQSQFGRATLSCSSGSIDVKDVSFEHLKATITSGDFYAKNVHMSFAHIEASSGDVFTSLHPSMSNFTLEGVASSGDVSIDIPLTFDVQRENHMKGSVGTGEKSLFFRTTSGDVKVRM